VHSEALVLANANYAWNHSAPGFVDPLPIRGKALKQEADRYAKGQQHSDYLYDEFLPAVCARLYGEKAAPYLVSMFRFEMEKGRLLAVPSAIAWEGMESPVDWRAQAARNRQAKPLVEKALMVCDPEARDDLRWLAQGLEFGARLSDLYQLAREPATSREQREGAVTSLLAWLDGNFKFQPTDPDGGDVGIWKALVNQARQPAETAK
jgi:hypothetical protein